VVTATSVLSPTSGGAGGVPLVLDGRQAFVELLGIYINDKPLAPADYVLTKVRTTHIARRVVDTQVIYTLVSCAKWHLMTRRRRVIPARPWRKNAEDTRLTVSSPPAGRFTLGVVTKFKPQDNFELSGLYKSSGNFCTQCEAAGLLRISTPPTLNLPHPPPHISFSVHSDGESCSNNG